MSKLTFSEYQAGAATTAIYPKRVIILPNDWQQGDPLPNITPNVFYSALGGAGEFGEIANKIKKIIRDADGVITPEVRAAIRKEIGDAQWYVADLCTMFGFSLEEIAQENLDKLGSRKERGTLTGDGDNR